MLDTIYEFAKTHFFRSTKKFKDHEEYQRVAFLQNCNAHRWQFLHDQLIDFQNSDFGGEFYHDDEVMFALMLLADCYRTERTIDPSAAFPPFDDLKDCIVMLADMADISEKNAFKHVIKHARRKAKRGAR